MTVVGGREIHPINVRVGGFYRAPTRAELRALVEPLERAREIALATVRWAATLDVPRRRARPRARRARATRTRYPIDLGRIVSDRGLDIAPSRVRRALRRGARRALQRAARPAARARHLPDRAARPLQPGLGQRCGRWRARRRARPGSAPPAATRSRASSCARSSSCTPATRRSRSSTPTSRPTRPAVEVRAAPRGRPRRDRGAARACSTTATRSTTTARSSTRGSCRRPRRTSSRSRRTCAPSSSGSLDLVRRGAHAPLRAGDPQPRPVHLLRDPLPRADGRA